MLRKTKRRAVKAGAKGGARKRRRRATHTAYHAKRTAKRTAKRVAGPAKMVLAKGLPARPKGYLTFQKGTTLVAVKMNRKGGKRGRKVCRK